MQGRKNARKKDAKKEGCMHGRNNTRDKMQGRKDTRQRRMRVRMEV